MSTRIGGPMGPNFYPSGPSAPNDSTAPAAFEVPLGPVDAGSFRPAPRTVGMGLVGALQAFQPIGDVYEVQPGDSIVGIHASLVNKGLNLDFDTFKRRVRFAQPGIDLDSLVPGQRLSFAEVAPRAPTGAELVKSPIVRKTIEAAWNDSQTHDSNLRHEEGGWLYMNVKTGEVFTHRASSGNKASIDLSVPVQYVDAVLVGTFHTHPHPSSEGWEVGPSFSDVAMEMSRGTPGIIRSDLGYHPYGWERRMSLSGSWAYPGTPERPLG